MTLAVAAAAPGDGQAQAESDGYTLQATSGATLELPGDSVEEMLRGTRRLVTILEEDPDVLYYVETRGDVDASTPSPAYPWNAVRAESDSTARVRVPGNYREARRAYYAYAVRMMEAIRGTAPSTRCSVAVERETRAVSAFVDGWIVTRTLYGGPAFAPLDALAFARDAGHLPAMLVEMGDTRLRGCAPKWARDNSAEIDAYRAWWRDFDGGSPSGRSPRADPDPGDGGG